MKLKIAVLDMNNGHANESMRCIRQLLQRFGEEEQVDLSYDVFDVRQTAKVPDLSYDGYISSGGPGSPLPTGEKWERKFTHFLDTVLNYNASHRNKIKKPLFLICHSFQLACIHWHIGTISKRRSTSFGTFPVHKSHFGLQEPLLKGLSDPLYAVDSRDFQVTQPNWARLEAMGAQIMCLEKIRPHVDLERAIMAIRFSKEIFGTQFHPEADAVGMRTHFEKEDKKEMVIKNFGQAKYEDMIASLNDPDKITLTESVVFPNFLRSVLAQKLLQPVPQHAIAN